MTVCRSWRLILLFAFSVINCQDNLSDSGERIKIKNQNILKVNSVNNGDKVPNFRQTNERNTTVVFTADSDKTL